MSNRVKQAVACLSAVFALTLATGGRAGATEPAPDPSVQRQTSWLFATNPIEAQILQDEAQEEGLTPQLRIGDLGMNIVSRPASDQAGGSTINFKFTFK